MRIFRKIIVVLFTFILSINSVQAASKCDTAKRAELNREVANIKASYEILERSPNFVGVDWFDPETMTLDDLPKENYFKINITNLSENFYAEITNDKTSEKVVLTHANSVDGVASFERDDLSEVVKLTIKIFTTDATGCPGEEFRTNHLTLPRYNFNSQLTICSQIPNHYLCQPFVTYDEKDDVDFYYVVNKAIESEKEKTENEKEEGKTFAEKYLTKILITGGILIVGGGIITTLIIRNRRRREI